MGKCISKAADTSQRLRKLLPLKGGPMLLLLRVDVAAVSNVAVASVIEAWRCIFYIHVQHGVKTCAAIDAFS